MHAYLRGPRPRASGMLLYNNAYTWPGPPVGLFFAWITQTTGSNVPQLARSSFVPWAINTYLSPFRLH